MKQYASCGCCADKKAQPTSVLKNPVLSVIIGEFYFHCYCYSVE